MRSFFLLGFVLALGAVAIIGGKSFVKETTTFSTVDVSTGTITKYVRATGTVNPVRTVEVGAFVSGPVEAVNVDFNANVKKGTVLAEIDPRLVQADVERDTAALEIAESEVAEVKANLQLAIKNEQRALELAQRNPEFVSEQDLDQLKFNKQALQARLKLTQGNVKQAKGRLKNSTTNLKYTKIVSPVDGVVIHRQVEPGQTVVASFSSPVLFFVAPDLKKEMHVFAKIDEADIGLVIAAKKANRPVHFTVDAHPREVFKGHIKQIRSRSSTVDNVVTFPVVISTANPDLKLLPGMTADLYIEADVREDVTQVPNSAILFRPPAKHVRPEDRRLLQPDLEGRSTAPFKVGSEMYAGRDQRYVWIQQGQDELLRAVPVTVGINDENFTEVISDEISDGHQLVVGIKN